MDLSLMRISRSESRNSRTRLRLFLDGNISISYYNEHRSEGGGVTDLGDILMPQFLEVLYLTNSRHVHACDLVRACARELAIPSLNCPILMLLMATLLFVPDCLPR
jgi:hypothetical protein